MPSRDHMMGWPQVLDATDPLPPRKPPLGPRPRFVRTIPDPSYMKHADVAGMHADEVWPLDGTGVHLGAESGASAHDRAVASWHIHRPTPWAGWGVDPAARNRMLDEPVPSTVSGKTIGKTLKFRRYTPGPGYGWGVSDSAHDQALSRYSGRKVNLAAEADNRTASGLQHMLMYGYGGDRAIANRLHEQMERALFDSMNRCLSDPAADPKI